ncbi:hypothetical protein QBC35DRAFT_381492 [Podospora australis]|uniref:C2H2-type domain-containing protein n=1 Tax=Podospora australis TaxID=1536484 RepID=A0AAN7AKH9_9PEZI|nr:hypothetical protein QBC35DRAFT_381492 [Podospora australis]
MLLEESHEIPNLLSNTLEDIEAVISQLVRVSVSIRRAGRQARRDNADRSFVPDRYSELRDYLVLLISTKLLTSDVKKQGNLFIPVHKAENPGALDDITERLITANLKRRHRFLYARRRWMKQPAGHRQPHAPDTRPPEIASSTREYSTQQLLTIAPARDSATTASHPLSAEPSKRESSLPTALDIPIELPMGSQPSMAAPSTTNLRVVYPKPPKRSKEESHFRCPCCCQLLPKIFASNLYWRKHLSEDIQPYTCLLHDCPRPEALYSSRLEWSKHMDTDHQITEYWLCDVCLDPTRFDSSADFELHLASWHKDVISADQIPDIISISKLSVPVSRALSSCPLCPVSNQPEGENTNDLDAMMNHLTEHMHSFALYSLPWLIPGEKEKEYLGLYGTAANITEYIDYFDVNSDPGSVDRSASSQSGSQGFQAQDIDVDMAMSEASSDTMMPDAREEPASPPASPGNNPPQDDFPPVSDAHNDWTSQDEEDDDEQVGGPSKQLEMWRWYCVSSATSVILSTEAMCSYQKKSICVVGIILHTRTLVSTMSVSTSPANDVLLRSIW